MSDDAQRTVEAFLAEVLNGARPESIEALVAHRGLRQKVAVLRAAFPDLSVTSQVLVTDGSSVAVHLAARGTQQGIFQGVPSTGQAWAASCTAIYRVQDGRIVEDWETWDLLGILEQIGGVRRAAAASA